MVFSVIDVKKEQSEYSLEVENVKKWWTSSRFRKIKRYFSFVFWGNCRPYTAESVVSKRGLLKIEYPSNTQAKKLFGLLEKHAKVTIS
jgi:isocitrate lyase